MCLLPLHGLLFACLHVPHTHIKSIIIIIVAYTAHCFLLLLSFSIFSKSINHSNSICVCMDSHLRPLRRVDCVCCVVLSPKKLFLLLLYIIFIHVFNRQTVFYAFKCYIARRTYLGITFYILFHFTQHNNKRNACLSFFYLSFSPVMCQ